MYWVHGLFKGPHTGSRVWRAPSSLSGRAYARNFFKFISQLITFRYAGPAGGGGVHVGAFHRPGIRPLFPSGRRRGLLREISACFWNTLRRCPPRLRCTFCSIVFSFNSRIQLSTMVNCCRPGHVVRPIKTINVRIFQTGINRLQIHYIQRNITPPLYLSGYSQNPGAIKSGLN